MNGFDRRSFLIVGAAAGLGAAAPAPGVTPVGPDDMVLGSARAPVTVIEYASASCPHCARWALEVFPEFRWRFVITGQVRFVLRELLTAPVDYAAGGFLLARCVDRRRYFEALAAVFAAQAEAYRSDDARAALAGVGQRFGITSERMTACLTDPDAVHGLERRLGNTQRDGVNSSPTFIVGGQRLVGEQTIDQLAAAIARAGRIRPRRR